MSILTNEDLKLRKEEAHKRELRQNVKSHCTKIRDGIRKNGSTSGKRAIWELFQNAGDLAKDGSSAEIRIILNEDTFIFAHKGKSFTYDSLCSLVKQVSSQEKEDDDTVGQYGTGFLTTHKFGRKIVINGSMLISEMIKTAITLKLELLTLEVRKSNIAAQGLYKKYGFDIIGERKRYYSDNGEDAWIMTKSFEPCEE